MRAHVPGLSKPLLRALDAADDGTAPIAEINRRVGEAAELLGILRPSYELVRQAVHRRRRERRELGPAGVALDVAFRVRPVDAIADHPGGRGATAPPLSRPAIRDGLA